MDFNLNYNTEFKKTTFTIGDQVVNGFKDILGYRYMDNTQLAKLIGKGEYSTLKYWRSKSFKTSVRENLAPCKKGFPLKIRIGSSYHSLVPTDWAVNYILHWAYKGNKYAQVLINKLMDESLNNRIDYAFGNLDFGKSQKQHDALIALAYQRVNHARNYSQLMAICERHGFNVEKINDLVMIHLTGCHTKHFEIDNKHNLKMSLKRARNLVQGYDCGNIDDGVTPSMMDIEMLKSRNRILEKLNNKLYQVKRGSWSYDNVQNWMQAKVKI